MTSGALPSSSAFVDALGALVAAESPTEDREAVTVAQQVLAGLGRSILGCEPVTVGPAKAPVAQIWRRGPSDDPAQVLLLGHVDTVWPVGTTEIRPFDVRDGRAVGPGVFDMKAGLAIGLLAIAGLPADVPVSLMVTADEEVGSWDSREAILTEADRAQAVLVLEGAGPDGKVKSARKGWSVYRLTCHGTAAHAGLDPERGRNALVRMTDLVRELTALDGRTDGRTVTPTRAASGTTVNTIPHRAELDIDVRTADQADQQEVDLLVHALAGLDDSDVEVRVSGGINRPPMERDSAVPLLTRLDALPFPTPADTAVGGISDANLTAAAGIPTLDGLGAVGGGAHADDEWVDVAATLQRIPLLQSMIRDLVRNPLDGSTPRATHPRSTR